MEILPEGPTVPYRLMGQQRLFASNQLTNTQACRTAFSVGAAWTVIRVARTYLKRVIVTPAVYLRLDESLHFDIQSTGQKSHCVNITL